MLWRCRKVLLLNDLCVFWCCGRLCRLADMKEPLLVACIAGKTATLP